MVRLVGYTPKEQDTTVTLIDAWFDRGTRSWVIQSKNLAGDQIGEAPYVGTREDAKHAVAMARRAHPGARVLWSS